VTTQVQRFGVHGLRLDCGFTNYLKKYEECKPTNREPDNLNRYLRINKGGIGDVET